jgi:hypothetical protein
MSFKWPHLVRLDGNNHPTVLLLDALAAPRRHGHSSEPLPSGVLLFGTKMVRFLQSRYFCSASSSASTCARAPLGGKRFGTDLNNQPKSEVNRMTHQACCRLDVRHSGPSPYLWPAPADACTSASGSVPLSFATAAIVFPGAELNLSRPVAGDTKTREFEKVAT